ncbi:MAG: Verru_Chthon cassette protein B [Candidatus Udaeobacter sp.]
MDQEDLSAESAYHERHESRLQRSPTISIQFPGATPQASIESALSALNTSAVTDRRYSSYRTGSNSKVAAFSLVEIVLALGVAAFCLIAIVGLMPVGVQTNRNATSQTAATNIMAAIVADLRTTPAAATTSPQFAITFGTDKTLYFDALGQASTSLSTDSRYRLSITWNSAPTGLNYAVLRVTWPASVDPATTTPSGAVKILAAFDRS